MTLRFSDVEAYVKGGLTAAPLSYGTPSKPAPHIAPGPSGLARLVRKFPGPILYLTVGNGTGLTTEALYDQPFITARSIGKQNDYDFAETLAGDVDRLLLDVVNGTSMGAARVLYVTRTGGAPQLVELDDGERYHFQCTYIAEVKR